MTQVRIADRWIGDDYPTYFIADIGANHDGDLERAKMLIHLAAEAGADAAKFQNFRASEIVSARGFASLKNQLSHQSTWRKSVVQVFEDATLPWEWSETLRSECAAAGIHYLSTPYDLAAVDMLEPLVPAFKIGSGDITWLEIIRKIASKGKPVLLATGASHVGDVQRAVHEITRLNSQLVLMQCNTNYTGSVDNFRHVHLRVLTTYRVMFPEIVLGFSDHTLGHAAVLGAIALGARVVEKHFTDDTNRDGPDHRFSMTPATWREMVARSRELEQALGSTDKRVAENERDTVIIQRRCLRAARDLQAGTILTREHIDVLRPAPNDALPPYKIDSVLGRRLLHDVPAGECLRWAMIE